MRNKEVGRLFSITTCSSLVDKSGCALNLKVLTNEFEFKSTCLHAVDGFAFKLGFTLLADQLHSMVGRGCSFPLHVMGHLIGTKGIVNAS